MEKKQLMEYLKVVCDAENAIYACEETLQSLQNTLENDFTITTRVKRIPVTDSYAEKLNRQFPQQIDGKWILPPKPLPPSLIHATPIRPNLEFPALKRLHKASIFSILPNRKINKINTQEVARVKRSNAEKIAQAEKETQAFEENAKIINEQRTHRYNEEMEIYNAHVEAVTKARDEAQTVILIAIAENKRTRDGIAARLKELYDQDIIYPTFRNMVAVNQMYEYLAMGMCDGLQGPHGAYAQYTEDLRVNKICGSVKELQQSLEKGLNHLLLAQSQLVQEMKNVRSSVSYMGSQLSSNISSLGSQINAGFERMDGSVQGMRSDILSGQRAMSDAASAIQSSMNSSSAVIDSHMKEIKNVLDASAHNEYIALREKNIKEYKLKNTLQW